MAQIFSHGDLTLGGVFINNKSLTDFPANPKPYTQAIVNGVPYAYVDMSNGQGTLFSWLPMANKPNTYLHQQGVPATDVTVTHNLNTAYVGIFVYDADNKLQFSNFDVVDSNQIIVHLAEAITCNVVVFGYNTLGAATVAGTTVKVGDITLSQSATGNLLVDGQALATNDRVDAILALAPEDFDTFAEVATNLGLKADKATTYTKTEVDSAVSAKANSATTLSGYGITNAYTKTEVDSLKTQYVMLSGGSMSGPITSLRETKVALASSAIDLATGNTFTYSVTANTSFTVTNVPATGQSMAFILELTNGGSKTVSYWTGVKWAGGTAPTLTAAGLDVLGFYTHDGGATWRGLVLGKDIK